MPRFVAHRSGLAIELGTSRNAPADHSAARLAATSNDEVGGVKYATRRVTYDSIFPCVLMNTEVFPRHGERGSMPRAPIMEWMLLLPA